ncbi:MAG: tripartite tricarboxylate transporter substrate binding protein [Thermodesulfobacteriota bacterium]
MKRTVLLVFLALVACSVSLNASVAYAQRFPDRPIQLIVPNVPGSIMDINARLLTEEMGKILGTQIVALNKPGAASTLGTSELVRSKKDGYTIGYLSASSVIYTRISNPEAVHYDPAKDLEPLGLHVFVPLTVTVQETSPWKTFPELVDHARKNPGKLRVSTIGVGGIDHFNLEIIQSTAGVEFTHVPFKGGESVITALMGGHVEVTFDAFGKILPHADAGKLRMLLISKKMPGYEKIPTATELGCKQDLLSTWFAFYAPAGLPEDVKKSLVSAVQKTVTNPEFKAKAVKMGYVPEYKSPADLSKLVAADYGVAGAIAKKIGVKK